MLGRPDIVFTKQRVVIFVDGDFWHGRDIERRKERLLSGANGQYWVSKIEYNLRRDQQITRSLVEQDWTVLRIWETDILKDRAGVLDYVERALATGRKSQ